MRAGTTTVTHGCDCSTSRDVTHRGFQLGYTGTEGLNSLMKENSDSDEDKPPVGWHGTSDDHILEVLTEFVKTKRTIFNSASL